MEPQTTGVKTWQWVITAIVIIVLIIIGIFVFRGDSKSEITNEENPTEQTDSTSTKEVNRIVMSDQYPGNVVQLTSVQLAKDGWVVIHADKDGQPGDVIGSAYFSAGINPGKITLSRSTVDGGVYYAMIHTDDGDKKFDPAKDLPLKDSKGSIIMKLFRASATATVDFKG